MESELTKQSTCKMGDCLAGEHEVGRLQGPTVGYLTVLHTLEKYPVFKDYTLWRKKCNTFVKKLSLGTGMSQAQLVCRMFQERSCV